MSEAHPALEVADLTVTFGAAEVLSGVSLSVSAGTAVGLVGPNGAGKTTLLDAVSGFVPLARGSVRVAGVDVTRDAAHRRARRGLGRTFQGLDLFDDMTVEENLLVAADASRSAVAAPDMRPWWGAVPSVLSHDQRKALGLARALAGDPRVLLLDEPAAGLDAAGRQALTERLRELTGQGRAVLVADHDVELVLAVCDRVVVLDLGKVVADGPPDAVRADSALADAYLGQAAAAPSPRPASSGTTGKVLLSAEGIVAGYGAGRVVDGVDMEVRAGEVVALLGPNGAGKTTTLRALSGLLPISAGRATALGLALPAGAHKLARAGLAHVPQDRAVLGSLTVAENLRLAGRGTAADRDEALDRFPVLAGLLDRKAGRLSGGEQQLLALARALAARPQLLMIDELSLGLAPRASAAAIHVVRDLADGGAGVLLVEQHPGLALGVADRAVVLSRGRVAFSGAASELAARPDLLAKAYFGAA